MIELVSRDSRKEGIPESVQGCALGFDFSGAVCSVVVCGKACDHVSRPGRDGIYPSPHEAADRGKGGIGKVDRIAPSEVPAPHES